MPLFENTSSVASSRCKWRKRYRLKLARFSTPKGSWPWPWIGRVILHTVVHYSSTSNYIPNFIEIEETFCGRTYISTYICMQARTNGHLRPALLGRFCRRIDLIITRMSQHSQQCKHPRRHCFCALWLFDPKTNGFQNSWMEHFYVKFGDPSCSSFWYIMQKNRQTNAQTDKCQ